MEKDRALDTSRKQKEGKSSSSFFSSFWNALSDFECIAIDPKTQNNNFLGVRYLLNLRVQRMLTRY
jgi:hypothetical protein